VESGAVAFPVNPFSVILSLSKDLLPQQPSVLRRSNLPSFVIDANEPHR
jgi:hypothetical protein